jgi:hypothetical protein
MTEPTRLAGWGTLADGTTVTWTIAEGRRGRRWREVVAHGDAVRHALLLETDPGGRFSHLELARGGGLWTFHPETDGTLHGNVVGRDGAGIRHVEGWPFGPESVLLVEGSVIAAAAIAWGAARASMALTPGVRADVSGVVVRASGALDAVSDIRLERVSATTWRVGEGPPIEIGDRGAPTLPGGAIMPLERP